jgi:hypothetical protein
VSHLAKGLLHEVPEEAKVKPSKNERDANIDPLPPVQVSQIQILDQDKFEEIKKGEEEVG